MRRCTKCQVERDTAEFSRKRAAKDGLDPWCKPCSRANSSRRNNLPGARERKAEYDREYVARNRERILANCKRRYRANPERAKAYSKRWAAENRAARRAIANAYKARRRANCEGGVGGREIRIWLEGRPRVCHWCNADCSDRFEIDHVTPLARGGEHQLHNLVIACPPCNRRKSAKMPGDFLAEILGLAA